MTTNLTHELYRVRTASAVLDSLKVAREGIDIDMSAYTRLSVASGSIEHWQALADEIRTRYASASKVTRPALSADWALLRKRAWWHANEAGFRLTFPDLREGAKDTLVHWTDKESASKQAQADQAERLETSRKAQAEQAARQSARALAQAASRTASELAADFLNACAGSQSASRTAALGLILAVLGSSELSAVRSYLDELTPAQTPAQTPATVGAKK